MTKRVVVVEFGDQNTLLIDAGRARKIHACRSAQIVLKMEIMKIMILICSGFFSKIFCKCRSWLFSILTLSG